MTPTPTLDQARAAWLSGDGAAWARYTACLRAVAAPPAAPPRPAAEHRERVMRRAQRQSRRAQA